MSPAALMVCEEVEVVTRRFGVSGKKMLGTLVRIHSRNWGIFSLIVTVCSAVCLGSIFQWAAQKNGTRVGEKLAGKSSAPFIGANSSHGAGLMATKTILIFVGVQCVQAWNHSNSLSPSTTIV